MKISIELSEDLVEAVDRLAGRDGSRSGFIENALRVFIANIERDRHSRRDLEIINGRAGRLNQDAADTLEYQRKASEINAHYRRRLAFPL